MTDTPNNSGTSQTPKTPELDVNKLVTDAKEKWIHTPASKGAGYGAEIKYGEIKQHPPTLTTPPKNDPITDNAGVSAGTTKSEGFFNKFGEAAGTNWKGDKGAYKTAFGKDAFMSGGKGVMIIGGTVGIGAAIDGVRRMVTRPVGDDGQPGERSFGRMAIGAVEGLGGTALALTSIAGTLRR